MYIYICYQQTIRHESKTSWFPRCTEPAASAEGLRRPASPVCWIKVAGTSSSSAEVLCPVRPTGLMWSDLLTGLGPSPPCTDALEVDLPLPAPRRTAVLAGVRSGDQTVLEPLLLLTSNLDGDILHTRGSVPDQSAHSRSPKQGPITDPPISGT